MTQFEDASISAVISQSDLDWEAVYRACKPGAHVLAFGQVLTSHRTAIAIEDAGFEIRDCIVYADSIDWKPVTMARKPLIGTVASNVLRFGTGALNIDGCRIGTADGHGGGAKATSGFVDGYEHDGFVASEQGRWPANVILCEPIFDGGVPGVIGGGESSSGSMPNATHRRDSEAEWRFQSGEGYGDSGTASRFFAVSNGLRHLVRLITPPDGIVLAVGDAVAHAAEAEGFTVAEWT